MKPYFNSLVFYYPEGHAAHHEMGHPERPERVEKLRDALSEKGWWEKYPKLKPIKVAEQVLNSIHEPGYLHKLQAFCQQGLHLDLDTYTQPESWELALNTAGGAASCAQAVWTGSAKRCFALTRPPGHHATKNRGMGFCLLNNVALAAEMLIQENQAARLAIIDLDLHHGNGTQEIFYERGDVFYISTHQFPLYPGSGTLAETGEGDGAWTTANIPLPPGSGDNAFKEVVGSLILPILDRFQPEMLLISFGFDPHWRDPLGHLQISAKGYGEIIAALVDWTEKNCQGRIGLFLEGGYDLEAGATCSQTITAALLGESCQDQLGFAPRPEGKSWQVVVKRFKEIWGL